MNATTAHVPRSPARPQEDGAHARHRRRTVVASIGGAFLAVYLLGVSWVGNTLTAEMQRNLQGAPAVADVQHRG